MIRNKLQMLLICKSGGFFSPRCSWLDSTYLHRYSFLFSSALHFRYIMYLITYNIVGLLMNNKYYFFLLIFFGRPQFSTWLHLASHLKFSIYRLHLYCWARKLHWYPNDQRTFYPIVFPHPDSEFQEQCYVYSTAHRQTIVSAISVFPSGHRSL